MSKTCPPAQTTEIDADASTDEETELTRDTMFHVLQCRRRRLVLKYLQEYDDEGPALMKNITEHIAAFEHDTTIAGLRSQQRQRVYIALYQTHLTTMDDLGIIDYNQSRGFVEATPLTDRFDPYLDSEPTLLTDDEDEVERDEETEASTDSTIELETELEESTETPSDVNARWHKRYLYAAGGCLVVTAVISSGILSMPLSSQAGLGLFVSVLFALLAVSHWMTELSWFDSIDRDGTK